VFAGSSRAGQRAAAAVMSLIQSAWMNGHDPYASVKDVFTRLSAQTDSKIEELLPVAGSRHAPALTNVAERLPLGSVSDYCGPGQMAKRRPSGKYRIPFRRAK